MPDQLRLAPVDKYVINPLKSFISNSVMGGVVLLVATIIAVALANSPWSDWFLGLWKNRISLNFNGNPFVDYDLHHWINDGLISIFFFVLGLELKREMVDGQLSGVKNAILPIIVGISGMIFPALIFYFFNSSDTAVLDGWGIPMACDIAFVLGILYLLGDRIPASVKIFFTAFGIVDDLGAVLIIAFVYTSEISFVSLMIGMAFFILLVIANRVGVRSTVFYGIVGILGVWLPFLLSGVHATIAAVLVAFTIPATTKISEAGFLKKIRNYIASLGETGALTGPTLTKEKWYIMKNMKSITSHAMPPLQRLEHGLHPVVSFVVMPIFALANAGVVFNVNFSDLFSNNIFSGIVVGLLAGKFLGIFGVTFILLKLKLVKLPMKMNMNHLFGISILSGVGFTMCLFITTLAYENQEHITQAKIAIFVASIIAGVAGYLILSRNSKKEMAKVVS
ncbi:NhaA family Na+:H+ antiporter [Flavobacterium arsenatis]|uniref:Na(+)/H(+) antiporter NhaA n=1 Tax=Flavobacterium arsenatis TaxID=1484332 RepID=A0ABU1TQ83_9FLAO|nr:Na+/H+ antiporter NhaA [Flavobacterium arsenatis]MDR6968130.1 NhaA family Na+:H+ antiporter [Flavobacterium arsenatis]